MGGYRIDVNGNYAAGNVRWISPAAQMANTTRNRRLTWKDRTMTIAEWTRELGLSQKTISKRLAQGWPVERILGS